MQEKTRQTGCDTGDAATKPRHHDQCHATTRHWRRQQACTDQEKPARLLSGDEKKQYPLTSKPLRRNTAAHKHSSPTKDVLIGLLLHLSTLAAPQDDFVFPFALSAWRGCGCGLWCVCVCAVWHAENPMCGVKKSPCVYTWAMDGSSPVLITPKKKTRTWSSHVHQKINRETKESYTLSV